MTIVRRYLDKVRNLERDVQAADARIADLETSLGKLLAAHTKGEALSATDVARANDLLAVAK